VKVPSLFPPEGRGRARKGGKKKEKKEITPPAPISNPFQKSRRGRGKKKEGKKKEEGEEAFQPRKFASPSNSDSHIRPPNTHHRARKKGEEKRKKKGEGRGNPSSAPLQAQSNASQQQMPPTSPNIIEY